MKMSSQAQGFERLVLQIGGATWGMAQNFKELLWCQTYLTGWVTLRVPRVSHIYFTLCFEFIVEVVTSASCSCCLLSGFLDLVGSLEL